MNNLLKSIFISLFPLFALYVTIDTIMHLTENGFSYNYIGRLITAGTIITLFAGIFIIKRARTDANLRFYSLFVIIGFIVSFFLGGLLGNGDINGLSMSLVLVLAWFAYIKWYSVFNDRRGNKTLKVGKQLPEFLLEDLQGNEVSSTSFIGKPAIYLFYRGNWCPLCMAQIKEIAVQYKELEKRGVNTILVSPQPHKYTRNLANKFDVGFTFLTDRANKVAKQLDIFTKTGIPAGFQVLGYDSDTVLPTVVITDNTNKIIFADLTDNYRVRPEPETFLKVIDELA